MVVDDRKNVIIGNNALETSVRPLPKEKVSNPEVERRKREERRKARKTKILKFLKFNGGILLVGAMGLAVVGRYGIIYSNQKEIISLQENIQEIKEESEALSVKLLKYDNIAYIEEVATRDLNMVKPDSGEVVYCDLNSVKPIEVANKDSEDGNDIFSKLKRILFN